MKRLPPRFPRRTLAALAVVPLLCPPAAAAGETREVEWIVSGEARFRPEYRDDADLDRTVDDDLRQGFMRLRVGLDGRFGEEVRIFVQAQDARVAGEEGSTASNEKNLDLHQGFAEIGFGKERSIQLSVGRQEWAYGDHRLIGNFGWSNVGRAFDGARLRWRRGAATLDGLAARLTTRTAGAGNEGSDLYGVHFQTAPRPGSEYQIYGFGFSDRVVAAGEAGIPGRTRVHALGGRVREHLGRFDLVAEAVAETGTWNGDDLRAHAWGAVAGVTFGTAWKWRLTAGYDFATGDEDPADGERQEFFNFFPTNHPLYGHADYEGWRNLRSPWAGVSLQRGRQFLQVKTHRFGLEEARGAWKDAGGAVLGADPAGASGRSVGSEIDLTYRAAIREKVALEAGWSRFRPGRFARLTRGPDASDWGYVMLTVGF